jgi:hypothetical protein
MNDAQTTDVRLAIGGNNPPGGWISADEEGRVSLDTVAMREHLVDQAAPFIRRRNELLGSASRCPVAIGNGEVAKGAADLIKMISAAIKNAEADRVARKEAFLVGGGLTDSVYREIIDPLNKTKATVESRLTLWQRKVAAEERARREEEARRQAEEARRRREEAEAAAAALKSEQDLAAAIEAEEVARQSEADAVVATKAAVATPAELSRSRGEYGSVASLRTFWDFRDMDRRTLDLELLREHLPLDAIEKAVRSLIRAGGRQCRGVTIFENTSTQVR